MSERKQRTDATVKPANWVKDISKPDRSKMVTRVREGPTKSVKVNRNTWVECPIDADPQEVIDRFYKRFEK